MSRFLPKLTGILALTLIVQGALAQGSLVDYQKQVDMLVKLLSYNRNFLQGEEDIRIGLVYDSSPESTAFFNEFSQSLMHVITSGQKIGKRKITFSGLQFASLADLNSMASMFNVAVFVVAPGNDNNLASISKVAQDQGIFTYSSVGQYLAQSVATGVENVNGQIKIVVNLPLAKIQGAQFKAELLQVARVIK